MRYSNFTRVFHTAVPVHHLEVAAALEARPDILMGMYRSFVPFYIHLIDNKSNVLVGRFKARLQNDAIQRMIEPYVVKYTYMPVDSGAEQSVLTHDERLANWSVFDTRSTQQGKIIAPAQGIREGDMLLFNLTTPPEATLM